jgi:ATPase family associated with various cellular activities (AAA)
LYKFFSADFRLSEKGTGTPRDAMILAVAIVYYLRLDDESRYEFKQLIQSLPTERGARNLQSVLDEAMDAVIARTEIPQGIALTRGLKENVFMTLTCLLSRTPLLIVGPPGTSKTLAVNVTTDNSNGEDSPSEFYRNHARLSVYHYQCSKQSTSKEIAAVFEKATQQQEKLDPKKHLCFVFMDEAGLPEEDKESLKVLHYLLEGHMSTTSEVGFVGISNHVLDAAKSNRCVMLLRQEPDTDEMLSIAKGVLFDSREAASCVVEHVDMDGEHHDGIDFASSLCKSYGTLMKQHSWFETFFGLRDFIYFLKALRLLASFQLPKMTISIMSIVGAIERNFNGVAPSRLREIALSFLEPVARWPRPILIKQLIQSLSDPLEVIRQSLSSSDSNQDHSTRPRYKMIIDTTEDDSIIRLLGSVGIVHLTKKSLFKLSQLPEEVHVERMRLVAGVKYAALQGKLAVLSQTEPVNEAMYDLFNQRFHVVGDRLFANIAIGGISRRSLVRPSFECAVHVRESQLNLMPAPFLNRFEKYTLGTNDVLKAGWSRLGKLAIVFGRARARASHLLAKVPGSERGMFGYVDGQTLDSLFIDLLPEGALMSAESVTPFPANASAPECFADCLVEFLGVVTSLRLSASEVELDIGLARSCLPQELRDILVHMSSERQFDATLVRESLQSLVQVDLECGTMAEICSVLIQMVVTRVVVTRVMQIATPEAVYLGSKELPSELVSAYFSKEHFNLRRVIEQSTCTSATTKVILYARSEASIRSIPGYSLTHSCPLDAEGLDKIKELVHGNVDEIFIEHLSTLRSETMLRTSIETWIKDDGRKIFLLIVDMGAADSVDHVNFARTFMEQRLPKDKGKVFVMLLHHPPSVANRGSCYPALFLQGWNHVFLDGIGGPSGPAVGVENCIELACKAEHIENTHPGQIAPVTALCSSLQLMLHRVVGHVATHVIFSAEQLGAAPIGSAEQVSVSYRERYRFLMMHMNKSLDGETIGSILCSKFAALWLDACLLKTMRRASEGLLRGRTQLSLSMSVRSNLMDMFDAYLLSMVKEMNQGQSLSIVSSDSTKEDVNALFGIVLRDIPVAPFDELMLLRTVVKKVGPQTPCRFPFFPLISECLDDLLELAYQEMVASMDIIDAISAKRSDVCMMLHQWIMELLGVIANDAAEFTIIQQRRVVVREVTRFVQQQAPCDDSLFERYLHDFISRKTNCSSNKFALQWTQEKLRSLGFDFDIVAVHVVIKLHEKEFMSVASWSSSAAAQALEGIAWQSTSDDGVLLKFILFFERCLGCSETNRGEWSRSFARFLRQTKVLASYDTVKKEQANRLRVLSFFHILLCGDLPASVQSEALQLWYDRDQQKLRGDINDDDVALSKFAGLLGVCDGKTVEMTLRYFFSPRWVNITTIFREQDFLFLLNFIAKSRTVDSQLTPLLRAACLSYGSPCEASAILGIPAMALHLINCQLRSSHSAQFSSCETRLSLPHFIPNWLVAPQQHGDVNSEVTSDDPELGVYFNEYRHCFDGQLPETVFNMILQTVVREAETFSSEALMLSLLQDIEAEGGLRRDDYTRLARNRSRPSDLSLPLPSYRGTLVSAMILDARLICFISKTALELATQKNASALSGTYGVSCRVILDLCISMDGCRLGDFFMRTILQTRGEGTLASLLADGGALHPLRCCRPWIEGAPAMKAESQQELERAEYELADAVQEEYRKTLELRLCPHCGTTFIVGARECGTFKCGRDAHGGIGGVQVRAIYGCGQQFNIDAAPHYAVDASILNPLRTRIEELRNCMQRCDASALLWDRAKTMKIPMLTFCIAEKSSEEMLVPTASMAAQLRGEPDTQSLLLLQRLGASSDLMLQQSVLPDLIEVRLRREKTIKFAMKCCCFLLTLFFYCRSFTFGYMGHLGILSPKPRPWIFE